MELVLRMDYRMVFLFDLLSAPPMVDRMAQLSVIQLEQHLVLQWVSQWEK